MNRYISFIAAVCAAMAVTTASAQEWVWGLKGGLNVANISHHGENTDGKDQYNRSRFAGVAGLTGEYFFNDKFSLGAELLYSMQGSRYKYPTNYAFDDTDISDYYEDCTVVYKFGYINLPILFGCRVSENFDIFFKIGIQPGFRVSGSSKTVWRDSEGNKEVWKNDTDYEFDYTDINDDYYMFDLGIPVGLSYNLNKHWSVEARYTVGVLNTFDKPDDDDYDKEFSTTNHSFAITLGYKF
ncbi:MAG: porin family protein [Rikenellaceae bacterium]